jgi:hypothetical protein
MKKLFIILIACTVGHVSGFAQGAHIGITAGVAISNLNFKIDNESLNTKTKTGFTAGVVADLPLGPNFSFQPGLNYVQKGTTDDETIDGQTFTAKISVNNLELPLNFLFNAHTSAGNFFIGAGPSISYALSGKTSLTDGTNSESADIHFGNSSDDNMKRYDFGANFTTGFTFKGGLLLAANYNAGLSNLMPRATDGNKISSHYFGIRLGYMFGGTGKK